jgi:hypothetical protein
MILAHRTQLEVELDGMIALTKRADGSLAKIADGNLRKSLIPSDLLQKLTELATIVAEMIEQQQRCRDALPAFKAWAAEMPTVMPMVSMFAEKTGELSHLLPPKQTVIDPTAALAETMMRHHQFPKQE